MPLFRTKGQNKLMFSVAAQVGVSHDDLREWTFEITNGRTEHTSELYYAQAVEIINRLQALANPHQTPRRTTNYRRAKTGVINIDVAAQAKLLNELWFEYPTRTASGLESLCLRTIKIEKPRTTKEFNPIIEAVKSMNNREEKKLATQKEAA